MSVAQLSWSVGWPIG